MICNYLFRLTCKQLSGVLAKRRFFQLCVATEVISPTYLYMTYTYTVILWAIFRSTCFSRHLQLSTGGFCLSKALLSALPLLMATGALRLRRRRWSSPQRCYLHRLHTVNLAMVTMIIITEELKITMLFLFQ